VGRLRVYTYDPQGSVVQPVSLYPDAFHGPLVRVQSSSAYEAFGLPAARAAAEGQLDSFDPVGFGGEWGYYQNNAGLNLEGLYLLGHRYYDAGTGRFVTRDPIGYGGGINLYGLAGNNPVNRSDPSGFDDDPTGLPGDNEGHWGMTTSASGTHEGFKRGTAQNNARRSMTKGLISTFWDTVWGLINPEGKAAEIILGAVQAAKAAKLAKTPILQTTEGLAHVIDRHTYSGIPKFANKSKFNVGENVSALISQATHQPMAKQPNGRYVRTFDVGRDIGLDRITGGQTSTMTVVTEPDGTLVTAFPGKP
jgi:RHS repeat-associated protein